MSKNHLPIALYYGLLLGGTRVLLDVFLKMGDASPTLYYIGFMIGFIIEIAFVFYAVYHYKRQCENVLLLKDGIKIGVIMMLITGILFFLSMAFIYSDFQNEMSLKMIETYQPEKLAETRKAIEEANKSPKYLGSFGFFMIYYIMLGFVISFVVSTLLKAVRISRKAT